MALTATASLTSGLSGLCLKFVRLSLGAPARYATALKAWNAATCKHPGDRNPPHGVPVFFTAGRNGSGHVALSLGGGVIRSTDWPSHGLIGDTTIAAIEHKWGRTYLGWTEDLNGADVYTPDTAPVPAAAPAPIPAPTPTPTKRRKAMLYRCVQTGEYHLATDFNVQAVEGKYVNIAIVQWGQPIDRDAEQIDLLRDLVRANRIQAHDLR